jgi:hypothetical protein
MDMHTLEVIARLVGLARRVGSAISGWRQRKHDRHAAALQAGVISLFQHGQARLSGQIAMVSAAVAQYMNREPSVIAPVIARLVETGQLHHDPLTGLLSTRAFPWNGPRNLYGIDF